MKKRLFLVGTLLAALMALPGIAAAAPPDEAPSRFSAEAFLVISALPDTVKVTQTPFGLMIEASGEELSGTVLSSEGWGELTGAGIQATITNEVSRFNFRNGKFRGRLEGTIGAVLNDGSPVEGTFSGNISGRFDPTIAASGDLLGSISSSSVDVNWTLSGGGTTAKGQAHAAFSDVALDDDGEIDTFGGPAMLHGIVSN